MSYSKKKTNHEVSPLNLPKKPLDNFDSLDINNLKHPSLYINRELSWLEFNQRVLDQAMDSNHPILERVKFLSIVSSNLDEFFMIRMATLLKKHRAGIDDLSIDGMTTSQQIEAIRRRAGDMLRDQTACWEKSLHPLLKEQGIEFLETEEYSPSIISYLKKYFKDEIFPVLTPLAFDPGHPFPYISNLSTNFAVVVHHQGEIKFARVKIPSMLPRFIQVPESITGKRGYAFVYLEDVIRTNLNELFSGTKIEAAFLFRVIRDTDLVIQEDEADDLLESVDKSLKQVRYGAVSWLTVETSMPKRVTDILVENFEVEDEVVFRTGSRMNFGDFIALHKLPLPQLKDPVFLPPSILHSEEALNLFEQIKYQDFLIHHPYESFATVESFLRTAVEDPNVIAIKMTLYRIGLNSPIIDQLIEAAERGKQVSVLVELKARFDERNNILWARRLEEVGVHVVYGLVNLKTHCKLCLVVRKESDKIRRYAHLSTGNYNRMTAQTYTDLGLFTANPGITEDASEVFNYLTGYSNKKDFQHLLVAPLNLRDALLHLIERETQFALQNKSARLIFKCNHLTDPKITQALYCASQAGVKIDMIIRGVCCLRPGIPGFSENIRVISIVGRFLEHSRIYYFHSDGAEEIYVGSADLMERNLDHRVETLWPILDRDIRRHLKEIILGTLLCDNTHAHQLFFAGHYEKISPTTGQKPIDAQQEFLEGYGSRRYRSEKD